MLVELDISFFAKYGLKYAVLKLFFSLFPTRLFSTKIWVTLDKSLLTKDNRQYLFDLEVLSFSKFIFVYLRVEKV